MNTFETCFWEARFHAGSEGKIPGRNLQIPHNSYFYHLNKAYILVARDLDIESAKQNILICKNYRKQSEWRYSDAFLNAYEEKPPITVYRKYVDAFKYNLPVANIAEFIEYILEIEPNKIMLHLAAGLVYYKKGDSILAKRHFDVFFETYIEEKLEGILRQKNIFREISFHVIF